MVIAALLLAFALVPATALAVSSGYLAARSSDLQVAVERATLDAAEALNRDQYRSGSAVLSPDLACRSAASSLALDDARARLDSCQVEALQVSVAAHEDDRSPFGVFLGAPQVRLTAAASARLAFAYSSSG